MAAAAIAPAAETEPAAAAEPAPAVEAKAEAEAAPSSPPEKVELPDKAAFERKVDALKRTMAANKLEKERLKGRGGGPGSGPSKAVKEFREALEHKKAIRAEFQEARGELQKLFDRQKALRESRGKAVAELREGRAAMGPAEVDRRIAEIDERLKSEGHTLSLKAEKDLVKQRTELNKIKRESAASERSKEALEGKKRAAEAELDGLGDAITAAKKKRDETRDRLTAYDEVVNKAKAAADAEHAGSDGTRDRIRELAKLNNAAFAELKALQDAHYTQLKKAYAYRDWQRKQRDEQRAARRAEYEKAAADAERAAAEEDEASKPDHPWAVQLAELDQLANFLRKVLPGPAAAAVVDDSPTRGVSSDSKARAFADLGLGASAGPRKGSRGRRGRSGHKSPKPQELSFDLATMALFGKFGLTAPVSQEEAEALLPKVAALRAEFDAKPAKGSKPAEEAETAEA